MLRFALLLTAALTFTSCSTVQTAGTNSFRFAHRVVTGEVPRAARFVTGGVKRLFHRDNSFWDADGMRGKPSVMISLGEQMVYLYKGGQLAGGSPISSGAEG